MARTGIRFRPPRLQGSPEIDWALLRAFGPSATESEPWESFEAQTACDIADRLSLMARIRSRTARSLLEIEVGSERVEAFDRMTYLNTGLALQHEQVCRGIGELAAQMSIPTVLLKGMALWFMQVTPPGARKIADVDILVPRDSSERLHEELIGGGCEPSGFRAPDHHLSVLAHPLGSAVEIHHEMDGVRFDDAGYVTADQCLERGLVNDASGFPAGVFLPVESLLLAHLLTHGLSHHGQAPDSYPAFQLLADLQDMGFSESGEQSLPVEILSWIESDVSLDEVEAALALVRDLSNGVRASELVGGETPSAVLLRHFLSGSLSEVYVRGLKLSRRLESQRGRGRFRSVSRNAWQALWLSRTQVEILYGKPRTPLGYLGWRLWRPIDLLARSLASAVALWRTRKERR